MKEILARLMSRKFIVAISGIVGGIMLLVNDNVTEGFVAIISSVVAYIAAEGMVDMVSVKNAAKNTQEIIGSISQDAEQKLEKMSDEKSNENLQNPQSVGENQTDMQAIIKSIMPLIEQMNNSSKSDKN